MPRLETIAVLASALLAAGCASPGGPGCGAGEERSVNDVIYFGTARPHGTVTPTEWSEFLRASVTPRFPRGLTVWPASGQWLGADGAVTRESSFVVSLVHPDDERSERAVRAIAAEYKARFEQEAVLRVRSDVCASF